jgi:L-methionine (R)-S-oxide reductase
MDKKEENYLLLLSQVESLLDTRCGWIANYSNTCAAIWQMFGHWWCGFYFVNKNGKLELGPFQGPVACTLIEFGKGVCGSAWERGETIIVPDVHQFDGHIACSSESNSEIVVPIIIESKVIGVLDIDSVHSNHFDNTDRVYLEKIVKLLSETTVNF